MPRPWIHRRTHNRCRVYHHTGQNDLYHAPPDQEDQYEPAILTTMSDLVRKRMEAAWADKLISIATRCGTLRGITENFREAIDKQYYEDLEDKYTGATIRQFFDEPSAKTTPSRNLQRIWTKNKSMWHAMISSSPMPRRNITSSSKSRWHGYSPLKNGKYTTKSPLPTVHGH